MMNGYMKLGIASLSVILISNGITHIIEYSNMLVCIYGIIQMILGIYSVIFLLKNRQIEKRKDSY